MTVHAIHFCLLLVFFVIDIDVVFLDMNNRLSEQCKGFANESRRDLRENRSDELQAEIKLKLTSFMQLARAIASLRRIMLSS